MDTEVGVMMSEAFQAVPNSQDAQPPGCNGQRRRLTAQIIGLGAIREVVDRFYDRVRDDALLACRFRGVSDWPAHKAKMTHFWWVALGGSAYGAYRYRVIDAHRRVGVQPYEVKHWLGVFSECVTRTLPVPEANAWLRRARAMGESLSLAARGED